ncbi:hypothetical protein PJU43_003017 [Enterobacter cloacae]|nr:hypothetical protein [Enterobacter cloacae]
MSTLFCALVLTLHKTVLYAFHRGILRLHDIKPASVRVFLFPARFFLNAFVMVYFLTEGQLMSADENLLSKIQEVRTVEDVEQVNLGLSKGWVILKITESSTVWEDGSKSSLVTYHMGKPKALPV